jgi:hypothetical protein
LSEIKINLVNNDTSKQKDNMQVESKSEKIGNISVTSSYFENCCYAKENLGFSTWHTWKLNAERIDIMLHAFLNSALDAGKWMQWPLYSLAE